LKIVYFPYTVIQPRKAEQLAALWGPVTLLQPAPDACLPETRALAKAGWIETLWPAGEHARPVRDHMEAFEQWAVRNTGSDLAALMRQGTPVPFFGDQSLAQIMAELRSGGKTAVPAAPEKKHPGDIFQDQLLLAMAQKFDRQQEELASQIETLARKERRMMTLLRGEEEVDSGPLSMSWTPPTAPREALLDLRIKAWARVMRTLPEMEERLAGMADDILFLTDNRSVMDQVQDHFPEAQRRLEGCPVGGEALCAETFQDLPPWLAQLLASRSVPAAEPAAYATLGLDLIEIPALPVGGFFRRLAGQGRQGVGDPMPGHTSESCWVGSLTWPKDAEGDAV
jgi:hypothetical protein